jgi:hypothetical protein
MKKRLIFVPVLFLVISALNGCVSPSNTNPSFSTNLQQLMYQGCMHAAGHRFQEHGMDFNQSSSVYKSTSELCICAAVDPAINENANKVMDAKLALMQTPNSVQAQRKLASARKAMDIAERQTLLQCMNAPLKRP